MPTPESSDLLIRDAYEQLSRDRAAAPEMLGDVYERVAVRRRRRLQARAALGVATLGCAAVFGLALSGGSPGGADSAPVAGTDQSSDLVVLTSGEERRVLEGGRVHCETFAADGSSIEFLSGAVGVATRDFLQFMGGVDQLEPGMVIEFPLDESGPQEEITEMLTVFATMTSDGPGWGPEASSHETDTTGTLEVVEASCGADPKIELVLDLRLGGEGDSPGIAVKGTLRSP